MEQNLYPKASEASMRQAGSFFFFPLVNADLKNKVIIDIHNIGKNIAKGIHCTMCIDT